MVMKPEYGVAAAIQQVTNQLNSLVVEITFSGATSPADIADMRNAYDDLKSSLDQIAGMESVTVSPDGLAEILGTIDRLRPRSGLTAIPPSFVMAETMDLVGALQQTTHNILYSGSRWWP